MSANTLNIKKSLRTRTTDRRRAGAVATCSLETWAILRGGPGGTKAGARAAGPESRALETDASRLKRSMSRCVGLIRGFASWCSLRRLAHDEPSGSTQAAAKSVRGCSGVRCTAQRPQQPHSSRFAGQPFVDTSTFLGPNPTDNFLFDHDSGAARNNLLCGHRLGMFKTVYPVPVFTDPAPHSFS
jgi:hypothetical protein